MNDSDLSDDDREQYESEWDDLSERDLLEGIFVELTQIRALLSDADTDGSRESVVYECTRCDWSGNAGEREGHAVGQHSAPVDMIESLFRER